MWCACSRFKLTTNTMSLSTCPRTVPDSNSNNDDDNINNNNNNDDDGNNNDDTLE